ncbi:MAG: PHB depolymerase family esterase [Polyangiaceae bacterium]
MPIRIRTLSRRFRCSPAWGLPFVLVCAATATSPALAAQWQNKVSYGGTTVMDLYVPDKVKTSPGVVVSLHYCSGTSTNAHGWFQSYADQYGFVIIAPSAGGECFDATPARSGEREAITKMVQYVITKNNADKTRVFAAGASSGACMTNALLAAYPDVFAAGSVLAGVPAGAWSGGNKYGWSAPAGRTAQQWGDIVRNANQGFSGTRPRVQLWHGTGDTTLTYSTAFPAEVAQWTNVFGVTETNATKDTFKTSQESWARTSYRNTTGTVVLETNVAQNAPHDLSGRGLWSDVVRFFALDKDPSGTGGASSMGGASAGGASAGGAGSATGGRTSTASGGRSSTAAGGSSSIAAGGKSTNTGGTASNSATTGGAVPSTGGAIGAVGGAPNTGRGGSGAIPTGTTAGVAGQSSTLPNGTAAGAGAFGGAAPTDGSSSDESGCTVRSGHQPLSAMAAFSAFALVALLRRKRRDGDSARAE